MLARHTSRNDRTQLDRHDVMFDVSIPSQNPPSSQLMLRLHYSDTLRAIAKINWNRSAGRNLKKVIL